MKKGSKITFLKDDKTKVEGVILKIIPEEGLAIVDIQSGTFSKRCIVQAVFSRKVDSVEIVQKQGNLCLIKCDCLQHDSEKKYLSGYPVFEKIEIKIKDSTDEKWKTGLANELSADGVRFFNFYRFELGETILVKIDIGKIKVLQARIKWIAKGDRAYKIAAEFEISTEDRKAIETFLSSRFETFRKTTDKTAISKEGIDKTLKEMRDIKKSDALKTESLSNEKSKEVVKLIEEKTIEQKL